VLPALPTAALVPGAEATLDVIERARAEEPLAAPDEEATVFSLIAGRIVRDRRGLAG
jgi:hypothetical protein